MTSVTINCSTIAPWFSGIASINKIVIGENVTYIDRNAFDGTAWYNNQPEGVVYIGYVAYNYKGDTPASVILKEGTKVIAGPAFQNCSGLTSFTIPESVTSISDKAFYGCSSLTTITSHIVAPFPISTDVFDSSLKTNGTLRIPAGTRLAYIEKGWTQYFANVVEMEEGELIWLSIMDAEQGSTDLRCKRGETYTFRFQPADGWQIHSVTYRGSDVTSWLTDDGEFTTPAMSKSTELRITYTTAGTGVKSISAADNVQVLMVGDDIVVKNAEQGSPILIYDLNGYKVASFTASENETRISTQEFPAEVLIVKVASQAVKVMTRK